MGRTELERALAAAETGGAARRRVALDALAAMLLRVDPAELDGASLARAAEAGVAADVLDAASARPPHAVLCPLVVAGTTEAIVRTFYVSLDPGGGDRLALEPDTERAVAAAIVEGRRLGGALPVDRFRLVAARPESLAGATIGGASLAAAALVSAHALTTRRSVTPQLVVTGRIAGSRVLGVGGVREKIEAAIAIGARAISVPEADRAEAARVAAGRLEIQGARTTSALVTHALQVSGSSADIDDLVERALRAARHGWRGYRWSEARELLERALALVPPAALDRRLELYTRYAAAERHLGALERSARILEHAVAILRSGRGKAIVPHEARARAHQQLAMTALARGQTERATTHAARAVAEAERASSGRERVKALGCVGLVARAVGDVDGAVRAFDAALRLGLEVAPEDAARSRVYLAAAFARAGRIDRGRQAVRLALEETEREGSSSKDAWVRCEWAGALVAMGRIDEAARALDTESVREAIARTPIPGLLLRRHFARTLLAAGASDEAIALLLASDAGTDEGARLAAEINAWIGLAARAACEPLAPAEARRITESLAATAKRPGLATFLRPELRAAQRAIPRGGAALAARLEALVRKAEPLA